MTLTPRNSDEYWDGMRRRRLKRAAPFFVVFALIVLAIVVGALVACTP